MISCWTFCFTKAWNIQYAIFSPISPRFYSLIKLTLVEESQRQSAEYSWQMNRKSCSVLWSQTLFVWYFQLILEHMFSFVMRLLATRRTFLHGFVVIGTTFKSGSVIFSRAVYDAQFSFVTIYKVGKCMMPSVLKICSEFKSHVVYSSLKKYITLWKWMVCYCGCMLI